MVNTEHIARDVIVIGASAGGVEALITLFSSFSEQFPATVGVVLHRSPLYNLNLGTVLRRRSKLRLVEPHHGQPLEQGIVYLAPRDHHLLFQKTVVELTRGPKEHFTRPAIDPLFRSAARSFGARVIGLLLTGAGADGVGGLVGIKAAGGLSMIQDPKEARIPLMPMTALTQDHVDVVALLRDLPDILLRLARGEAVHYAPESTSHSQI